MSLHANIEPAVHHRNATWWAEFLFENLIWVLLILAFGLMAFLSRSFFSAENILNLGVNSTVLGILAISQVLCLLIGKIDISVESTLAFAALVGALIVNGGAPPALAMLAVIGVGALVGLVNGWAIAYLGANFFMQTLAMNIVLRGLMLVLTSGITVHGLPENYRVLGATTLFGIPSPILLMAALYVIFAIILEKRRWGRRVYMTGANERAALVSGIDTKLLILQVYVVSGMLAAFAGLLISTRINSVNNALGEGLVFEVLAAAVMGGVSLTGGRGRLIGALGGVLFLGCITSILTWLRVDAFVVQVTRGCIILLAIVLDASRLLVNRRRISASLDGPKPAGTVPP